MTAAATITYDQLIENLPPAWPHDLSASIRRAVGDSATKLVILDDDPTGTQTVGSPSNSISSTVERRA